MRLARTFWKEVYDMSESGKPAWIQADAHVWVDPFGFIHATLSGLRPGQGGRPNSHKEAGADPDVFEAIRLRQSGTYDTPAYVGGANVLLAPFDAFELVEQSDERRAVLERFHNKYGVWEEENVMLCCVRNDRAPAIHNCAEPAGGMALILDILLDAIKEASEIGLYKPAKGWYRFESANLDANQTLALQAEQDECWKTADPEFRMAIEGVEMEQLAIGHDALDDRPGVISAGSVGDFAITSFWRLCLELGGGYRFQDLERHFNGTLWRSLRRKCVMIANRLNDPPIMFELGPDGLLDRCGMHMALEGAALDLNISHLARAVLGLHGLNWLKE